MKQIVMVPIVKEPGFQKMSPSANLAKVTKNMENTRSLVVFRKEAAAAVKHNEAEGSSRKTANKRVMARRNLSITLAKRNSVKGGRVRTIKSIVAKEPTIPGCLRCQQSKKPCFARLQKIRTEGRRRPMKGCERCTALKKGCKWVDGTEPKSKQEDSSAQASSTSVGSKRKTDEIMEQTSPGELSVLSKKRRINEETGGLPNEKVHIEAPPLADPTAGMDDGLPMIQTLGIDEPDDVPGSNTTQGSILRYLHAMDLSMKAYERAYKGILRDVMKKLRDERAGGTFGESAPRMEDAFRQWYRKEKARTNVEGQRHV